MMIHLSELRVSELRAIDIGDIASWPVWFRWFAIALIAVALLLAGYKYVIQSEQKDLQKLQREQMELRALFLEKKEQAVDLPAYRSQMVEIQQRFGVLLKQLPDQAELPALLIAISEAGSSSELKFEQFLPAQSQTHQFYKTLPISITVNGKFHQLAEFISDLASLPEMVTVGDMNISRDTDQQLQMKARLHTYQYLQPDSDVAEPQKVEVDG